MSAKFDLTRENAFVRKTDETLRVKIVNSDNSVFLAGNYTFYLTIRKLIPSTSQADDNDTNVIIKKDVTVTSNGTPTELLANFSLTQTELDIEPRQYYYDVKYNDPSNNTISVTNGVAIFEVVADSTRRNV